MVESERMADLLTHNVLAIRLAVTATVEIRIVHFGGTLCYVNTPSYVDGRESKPAVEAVGRVA
jgi:hypothetical protein